MAPDAGGTDAGGHGRDGRDPRAVGRRVAGAVRRGRGDDELTAWVLEADHRRRIDVVKSLELIFERDVEGPAIDVLWILYSPETYWKLTRVAGLTVDEYKARPDRGDGPARRRIGVTHRRVRRAA